MKKIIHIFILILFSISLISCGNSQKTTSPTDTNTNTANKKIDVSMEAQPITNNGKTKFSIKTNLPNNTELMISLKNQKSNYAAQDKVSVSNGSAQTSEFSNLDKALTPGTYQLEITTPIASVQPSSVKSLIGDNGINLTGSYIVNDETSNKTVDFKKSVTIGN